MTATEVKDALRMRHPATIEYGNGHFAPGPWTTIEEWMNIDLLALSAWQTPPKGKIGVSYPIIGYEVKISRADYRRELRKPGKRAGAVAFCNAFYFAVPDGLLKPAELAWQPEPWVLEHAAWQRAPCRYAYGGAETPAFSDPLGPCDRGKRHAVTLGPLRQHVRWRETVDVRCEGCAGRGYSAKSRIELEAPGLWVPADVGLVTVKDGRATVVRKAPVTPSSPHRDRGLGSLHEDRTGTRRALAELARWLSVRPDPRHVQIGRDGAMP